MPSRRLSLFYLDLQLVFGGQEARLTNASYGNANSQQLLAEWCFFSDEKKVGYVTRPEGVIDPTRLLFLALSFLISHSQPSEPASRPYRMGKAASLLEGPQQNILILF